MKLGDYLKHVDKSTDVFAAEIGVSGATVRRWRLGQLRPSWETIPRIIKATNGRVTADDFIPSPSAEGNGPAVAA